MSQIAFPGFGIDAFNVNRVAFTLPFGDGFPVYWYGVIITTGIILAFLYACYRAYNEGVSVDDLIDIALWTVVCGVMGARLYFVFTKFHLYKEDTFGATLKNIFSFRDGGLAIYGGIICGAAAIIAVCLIKKINPFKVTDMAAPGVMIAQALGRWGNFFNGEAFGGLVEEGSALYFMRMGLISSNTISDFNTLQMVYVHPTFLYESLWNIIGFVFITLLYKKKKFNGQVSCMYLAWYGFGRMFIEGLRTDSLYVGNLRISQVVGLACVVIFGSILVWGLLYTQRYNDENYEFKKIDKMLSPTICDAKEAFIREREERKAQAAERKAQKINDDGENN
jgi:phosphatidylglycerol:prolipoprotein diacylglycerol transferase